MIDTGLGIGNIKTVVDSLTPLPVMAVTTHIHWDHIGGHKYFDNIAVHEAEKDWLSVRFPIPLEAVKRNLMCKACNFPKDFILDDYQIFTGDTVADFTRWRSVGLRQQEINGYSCAWTLLLL